MNQIIREPTIHIINNSQDELFLNNAFEYNRRIYYLDSSIWTLPVFMHENDENLTKISSSYFEKCIQEKVKLIERYHNRYQLSSAIENKDYNLRAYGNSWLVDGGAHTAKIEPFIFHSESMMKKYILNRFINRTSNQEEKDKNEKEVTFSYLFEICVFLGSYNKPLFRICLCDDYADKPLTKFKTEKTDNNEDILSSITYPYDLSKAENKLTKEFIIRENLQFISEELKSNLDGLEIDLNELIQVNICLSVDQLIKSQKRYDIILLDYLFSRDENGVRLTKPNYGTQFFEKVDESNSLPYGFLNTHWVLPISAFSDSMINELQNTGVTFTDDKIFLSKGADPISEPYLFLYELFYMMNEQIKVAIDWNIDWEEKTIKKITHTLEMVNTSSHQDLENLRDKWINRFSSVSEIFSKITKLELDAAERIDSKNEAAAIIKDSFSYLAKSLMEYLNTEESKKKIRILTHYRDLLYQLAFKSYQDNETIFIEANKLRHALNH